MSRKGWIWIILDYIVGAGLSKQTQRSRHVVLAALFVAGLMVALTLGVHWMFIVLIAVCGAAYAVIVTGTSAWKLYVRRFIWPRGVPHHDDRAQHVFLMEDHDELELMADEELGIVEAARRHRLALSQRLSIFSLGWIIGTLGLCAGLILLNLPTAVEWTIAGLVLLPTVFFMRWMKVKRTRWYSRLLIAIGRCPSCGYDLLNLPVADDGCSVCPECGAAWRVPSDEQPSDAAEPTV